MGIHLPLRSVTPSPKLYMNFGTPVSLTSRPEVPHSVQSIQFPLGTVNPLPKIRHELSGIQVLHSSLETVTFHANICIKLRGHEKLLFIVYLDFHSKGSRRLHLIYVYLVSRFRRNTVRLICLSYTNSCEILMR